MPRKKKTITKTEKSEPKIITKGFKERCVVCGESFGKGDFLAFFDKNHKGRIICYDCYSIIKDVNK